jgi:hypothetical protein
MSPVSYLYIVTSRHPRVGKDADRSALVGLLAAHRPAARRLRSRSARADIRRLLSEPGLAGRYRRHTRPNGAVRPRTSVIDLSHGVFDQFFKVMTEIGFEQEARRRLIQPIVLFITDAAPVTAQSYAELRRRLTRTTFVPIHNEAASFMLIPGDFRPSSPNCSALHIPRLSPLVRGVIDKAGFSFSAYMRSQPGGPTEVHDWIGLVFAAFRELAAAACRPAGIVATRRCQAAEGADRCEALSPAALISGLRTTPACAPARRVS